MSTTDNEMLFFHGKASPLSNWHPKGFWVKAIWFEHVEQFMMFCKAKLFNDEETAQKILNTNDPGECKRFGRLVKNFNEAIWEQHREHYVYIGAREKFKQNPSAAVYLLSTNDRELVECTDRDMIWANGIAMDDPRRFDKTKWKGLNLLGPLLMRVRDELS